MVKFINSLVFVACGWFSASAAHADAVLLYTFETTSIGCNSPFGNLICNDLSQERESLDTMYIGVSPAALSNGSATLKYAFLGGAPSTPTVNQGIDLIGIYLYNYPSLFDIAPPAGYVFSPQEYQFLVTADFELVVGQYLTGSFDVLTYQSQLKMSTVAEGTEWSGSYNSDALNQVINVTGNWRLRGAVPEPGTLALLMAALAGVALASNRRFPRERMARNTRGRANGSTWT